MSDEKPAREPIDEDARIDALEERLKAARSREDERNRPKIQGASESEKLGNRVLSYLLGGILGGAVVGWVIDQFAGTSPWGLLVMLFLGIVVGFRNIIRISSQGTGNGAGGDKV